MLRGGWLQKENLSLARYAYTYICISRASATLKEGRCDNYTVSKRPLSVICYSFEREGTLAFMPSEVQAIDGPSAKKHHAYTATVD